MTDPISERLRSLDADLASGRIDQSTYGRLRAETLGGMPPAAPPMNSVPGPQQPPVPSAPGGGWVPPPVAGQSQFGAQPGMPPQPPQAPIGAPGAQSMPPNYGFPGVQAGAPGAPMGPPPGFPPAAPKAGVNGKLIAIIAGAVALLLVVVVVVVIQLNRHSDVLEKAAQTCNLTSSLSDNGRKLAIKIDYLDAQGYVDAGCVLKELDAPSSVLTKTGFDDPGTTWNGITAKWDHDSNYNFTLTLTV
jgi:hypothetical protein